MTSTSDRIARAYRLDRARVALLGALPSFVYVLVATLLGATRSTFVLGSIQLGIAAALVYVGAPYSRGVGLGYLLGLIPFVTASVAQGAGHLCLDGACLSVCAPACTAAGVVTGVLGSCLTLRTHGGLRGFGSMAAIVALAGAMGCRCLGFGSMAGLLAGLVVASLPVLPRLVADGRR